MIAADNPHKKLSDEWFAYNQLRLLKSIAAEGLSGYDKLESFWYDFYPNFSWDDRAAKQIDLCLADPTFEALEAAFYARFGVSLRAQLSGSRDQILSGQS